VNSYDLGFLTDARFGAARPLPETPRHIAEAVAARDEDVIITTGFIGKNAAGEITTVGRQGSDYTASYFGAVLGAEEVQIWSDVDGILTADPSVVPEAKPLDKMGFREAAELSYYGAAVLHPSTIVPAVQKGIPIRVLNTFKPSSPGTLILPTVEGEPGKVKSVVYKEDLTLINVVSTRMLGQAGFMSRLFDVLSRHDVIIDMIATSEISVSMTTDGKGGVDAAAQELRDSEVAEVSVEPGKAIICVVGSGMRHVVGLAARTFNAVADAGVNIQMISQGASEINIAFLVDNPDISNAVRALHGEFF
jgi:aspartate kinase